MGQRKAAFSVIEIIVVVAIMGTLVALVAPALYHARQQARRAISLSKLRSHVMIFSSYAQSYDEYFPYFTNPRKIVELEYRGTKIPCRYFDSHFRWPVALAADYYNDLAPHPSQLAPTTTHICSYYYSASFFADTRFSRLETRTGPAQWRAVRRSEVVFPSAKALFSEVVETVPWVRSPLTKIVGLGMVDGSAQHRNPAQCAEPVLKGEGPWKGAVFQIGIYGMHTVDGVAGRDVVP